MQSRFNKTLKLNFATPLFSEEQARSLAETVSVDRTNHSVSFNEFLKLMSMQRDVEPDEETLLDMFR